MTFTPEMKRSGVINEENLGDSKVALVYGQMNDHQEQNARRTGCPDNG